MPLSKDFKKILLGEGKLYKDHGETGALELGYVRGGEFNENLTVRHIEVDGKKGPIIGDAVTESSMPTLTFNAVQMDASLLKEVFYNLAVVDNTDGTGTITRAIANPEAADYLTNVAFVGKTKDGTAVVIKLLNALGEGPVNFAFTDKGEVEIPCLFTGNYETIDDTTAPFEITLPYADSVIA